MLPTSRMQKNIENDARWRDRVQRGLTGCFDVVADAISPDQGSRTIDFTPLKIRTNALVFRAVLSGGEGVVKIFDGAPEIVEHAYRRERDCLLLMQASRQVPQLLCFSDLRRFIVTRSAGESLDNKIFDALGAEESCRRIGRHLARFDLAAPSQLTSGDWFKYASKLTPALAVEHIERACEILSGIPLCGNGIALNDPALHNFLLGPDGEILRCDLERATMRPRGWDYIQTYWAIIERFGDCASDALDALSEGFASQHHGALMINELNTVARILFCARAVSHDQR
jgi:hypothetical protein